MTYRSRIALPAVACLQLLAAAVMAQQGAAPAGVPIEKEIVYASPGGVDLQLDFARPAGEGPFPVVACFHGGGWQRGDKASHHATLQWLAANGFAGAAVEYRLTPQFPWPAQIEDAKCAVRHLRSHAAELRIDPNRVAALGDSAGGHLSLLLGLMDDADGFNGGCGAEIPFKVQAVVNIFGPTDFRLWRVEPSVEPMIEQMYKHDSRQLLVDLVGTADLEAPVMRIISPVTYVGAGDAPVITFQGTKDPLVPVEQARALDEALRAAGVESRLEIIENGTHAWMGKLRERFDAEGLKFLMEKLKPGEIQK